MIPVIRVKDGVSFEYNGKACISPAGFHILSALEMVAARLSHDLTITSACDGEHSGPDDPHHRGEAYDVRSHDLDQVSHAQLVNLTNLYLNAAKFYAFIEDEGTPNEHMHVQLRHGILYP